ncbi:MAG: hypothetical protein HOH04_01940 [Rhodospirillaceae bacterium]|jgi:hypothetical protein|nr:hypothetical protein [Rhodospirillaceae bacterium]
MSQGETLIHYAPVAQPNTEALDLFRCLPIYRTAEGQEFGTDVVLGHKGDIENTAGRNAAILRLIFKALFRAHAQGQYVQVIVPVNSIALANRKGATIIHDVFAELEQESRAALTIEIFNLPEKVSIDSLSDITIPMLPYTDRFIAHPHPAMEDYTVFANCNYRGVACDMATTEGDDAKQLDDLTDFWGEATKRRLGLCVQNAATDKIVATARRWEAIHIDGPLIAPPVERPGAEA